MSNVYLYVEVERQSLDMRGLTFVTHVFIPPLLFHAALALVPSTPCRRSFSRLRQFSCIFAFSSAKSLSNSCIFESFVRHCVIGRSSRSQLACVREIYRSN